MLTLRGMALVLGLALAGCAGEDEPVQVLRANPEDFPDENAGAVADEAPGAARDTAEGGAEAATPTGSGVVPPELVGTWRAVHTEDQARHDAIEEVVERMGPITGPVARIRLTDRTQPCERVSIGEVEGRVRILCDRLPASTTPPDGTKVPYRSVSGEELVVSQRVDGASIVQVFEDDAGTRENAYAAREGALFIRTTIRSPRLPAPVFYVEEFRRAE